MQELEITFFKDKAGKVIGRIPSGKIAIISYEYKEARVEEKEVWKCRITCEHENKVIVVPFEFIKRTEPKPTLPQMKRINNPNQYQERKNYWDND